MAIKKNEIMPFAVTWMDSEITTLSEARKRQTNIKWYNLYVEPNMQHKWTFLQNKHIHGYRYLRLVAKVEGFGGGKNWEIGISSCKLSCLEWINKALLYTENYGQYPVIKYNRKNMKKKLFMYLLYCWTTLLYSRN